jgi:hypothetical protein
VWYVLLLAGLLFGSGAVFGAAATKLRVRPAELLLPELRGWLACERAACEELEGPDREAFRRRLETRVAPRLRLLYQEAVPAAPAAMVPHSAPERPA